MAKRVASGERKGERGKFGVAKRGGISDRFFDNYVNADVLAARSAANNVITESHYCTHAVRVSWLVSLRSPASVKSCFSSFWRARPIKGCKSALISGSFHSHLHLVARDRFHNLAAAQLSKTWRCSAGDSAGVIRMYRENLQRDAEIDDELKQ